MTLTFVLAGMTLPSVKLFLIPVNILKIWTHEEIAVIILKLKTVLFLLQSTVSKRCRQNDKQCRPSSEQSDLGLRCLPRVRPVCSKTYDHYGYWACIYIAKFT